jgi:V/A-type H+-transporting ATPase subunit B
MLEYKTITEVSGPLIFVEKTEPIGYNELVYIKLEDGTTKRGQVLDTSKDIVVVQIFEGTGGLNRECGVRFTGGTIKLPVSIDLLGRILSGSGDPLDGGPKIVADDYLDINGAAMNPYARKPPADFIQTGISTIDGMNTLVRTSAQRDCSSDRKTGKGARKRGAVCRGLRRDGYHKRRGADVHARLRANRCS